MARNKNIINKPVINAYYLIFEKKIVQKIWNILEIWF